MRDRLGQCPRGQRGPLTGPNPTDRGKLGSKIHVICDRNGLPISVGISGANLHDSQALIPLMRGIPPIRSRYGPRRRRPAKLHADKGYDFDYLRGWLRRRQIVPRIARRGIESSDRLGAPLGGRADDVLAERMPPPAPPLRAQGRALSRLRRHLLPPDLLPEVMPAQGVRAQSLAAP